MEEGGDRFPAILDVVERLVNDDDFPDEPVERIEVRLHASGDATYRVWRPRDDEAIGGYLSADDLS